MMGPPFARREERKEKEQQKRRKEKGEAVGEVERNCPGRSQLRIYRPPGTNWIVRNGRGEAEKKGAQGVRTIAGEAAE